MNIRELCYELYKEDWKILHNITGEVEQRYLIDYYLDLYDYSKYSYKDYIEEYGYNGELYACYDEFLDNEYLEEEYILSLLQNKILQEEYLKDIRED